MGDVVGKIEELVVFDVGFVNQYNVDNIFQCKILQLKAPPSHVLAVSKENACTTHR